MPVVGFAQVGGKDSTDQEVRRKHVGGPCLCANLEAFKPIGPEPSLPNSAVCLGTRHKNPCCPVEVRRR